jgi:putative hemolysin
MLLGVRADVKILANPFLMGIAELRELFLEVDPFGGLRARSFNRPGVRAALKWLAQGGMLVMFPAGEVSSLDLSARQVVDPAWQLGAARLMRKSGACVLPIHIGGRNSNLFQLSGLINAKLRTLLLVRELLKPRRLPLPIRVGRLIDAAQLTHADGDRQVSEYLRFRTYALAQRDHAPASHASARRAAPIAAEIEREWIAAEIAKLPASNRLLSSGKFDVLVAEARQMPRAMAEIGRLREIAFRAAGEGTGRAADIDAYDAYYEQLVVWDRDAQQIVGGYRIGHARSILARHGPRGLYVSSLFRLSPRLLTQLSNGLELGRSFVRPEYQRSFSPLLLLWKGIAHYVARHPERRLLFGPVSISNDYHPMSQRILVQFLARHYLAVSQTADVKPRQPVKQWRRPEAVLDALAQADSALLDDILRELEADGKGMPVLLRQYLKLGGRILGFNVDPAFNRVIDCLLLVDLHATGEETLGKYMGREAARRYLARSASDLRAA